MDSRYRSSANMPHRYDPTANNPANRSNPISSRYFHRPPLIYPQNVSRHSANPFPNPSVGSPIYTSSYLGPLPQHRPRFHSSWDLAPSPTIYLSSRNINAPPTATATTVPSSMPMPPQPQPQPPQQVSSQPRAAHEHGACMFNSCVPFQSSNWLHAVEILCKASRAREHLYSIVLLCISFFLSSLMIICSSK